jgi:eukaryotic-like serine/threonine-protein kinase
MAVRVDVGKSSGAVDPLVGQVIHDRFRVIAPIARGGMGAVYKAEQAPLGRLVAIKVLSPRHDEDKDPEFRKRFFLEAATVAKLSHPNTVTVFDYGQSNGLYFIVMELIDGVTLKKAIRDDVFFDPARTIHITKQICRSLREAHRLGIIHRDMKPGNVMLMTQGDETDYVKVLDFGLVKDIESNDEEDLTQAGVFMGSPKYMSPEQIQGERVDGRSDIYSVGVLMYEMLSSTPPFVREKQVQILMDHINAPVPPLRAPEGAAPIPDELARLVMRCLAKRREERFADMDQLLNALKSVAGELSLAMPPSAELAISGEAPRTPVSGIHSLSLDPAHQSSSGAYAAGTVLGGGIPSVTPTSVSMSGAVAEIAPEASDRKGPFIAVGLGVVALAIIAGLALVVFNPFADDEASLPSSTAALAPSLPRPSDPGPITAQPREALPPPSIRSVLVELDSDPPGAMVQIGEQQYGPTPAQVELTGAQAEPGTELTFVFSAEGFRETRATRRVPNEGTIEVSARMRRAFHGPARDTETPPTTREPRVSAPEDRTPAGYRESPY